MSLPLPWVEKIFTKLTLAYGNEFLSRWAGAEIMDVKTDWAHELAGYQNNPDAIGYALTNLPNRAPNVFQFRDICRMAPTKDLPRLDAPKADPGRVNAEIEKLRGTLTVDAIKPKHDQKAWAHRLKARHDAGDRLNLYQIQCYKTAIIGT
jgi:hypothetical protein